MDVKKENCLAVHEQVEAHLVLILTLHAVLESVDTLYCGYRIYYGILTVFKMMG